MKDIFQAEVLCPICKHTMDKGEEIREGYKLRFFYCKKDNQKMYHPLDLNKYQEFQKLREKDFDVKLRLVGNSFSVTIPKEIIDFEEEVMNMKKEMDRMMRLSLDEPGRISLRFRKIIRK